MHVDRERLDRLVDFGKRDFVGRRALAAEQAAGGPHRRLAGLVLDWDDVQARFDRHGLREEDLERMRRLRDSRSGEA